jgi:hypothetical protein
MRSELRRAHYQAGDENWEMVFTSWTEFTDEFESIFCPENEATTALMTLESNRYFQGKRNVDAYTDEFRELVALSGYTDPIAVVLKFRRGLQPSTQDKIVESGTDRPKDSDLQGWFQAACRFDLNRLANEAFCYTSRHPAPATTTTYPAQPTFSFLRHYIVHKLILLLNLYYESRDRVMLLVSLVRTHQQRLPTTL